MARRLVDMAIYLLVGGLFCDYAANDESRLPTAKYWLQWRMPEVRMLAEQVRSGESLPVDEFEALAGPVPVAD
jgi:hypothetical protein